MNRNKLRKMTFCVILGLILSAMFSFSANAEILTGVFGEDGDNVTWTIDTDTGTVELSGVGAIPDYNAVGFPFFYVTDGSSEIDDNIIKNVIINEGITKIGEDIFATSDIEYLNLPSTITEIQGFCWRTNIAKIDIKSIESWLRVCYDVQWQAASTVRLSLNGEIIEDLVIPYGTTVIPDRAFENCTIKSVVIPETVTSIGSRAFNGTYIDSVKIPSSVKSIYNGDGNDIIEAFNSNVTIYCYPESAALDYAIARNMSYIVLPYYITYDLNGGSGNLQTQEKIHGTDIILISSKPTKSGYVFDGWATEKDGEVIYLPGDIYSADKDLSLYAVWSPDEYTVKFNGNGGTAVPSAQTKYHDIDLTLSYTVPVRTGYVFKGWATTASAPATYQPGGKYKNNFGATLYAVWEAATYTVKYSANGGSGVMSSSEHTYNVEAALSENAYYRTGYQFLGWATSSSATVAEYKNGETVKNLTATDGKVVNLYAVWDYAYEIGDGYVKIEFSNIDPQNYASLQDFTITKDFIKDGKNTVKLEGITDNGYKTFKTRCDSIGNIVDLGLYKYALLECYMESSSSSSRNISLIFLGIGDNDKTYNFSCKNTLSSGTWENILFDLNDKEMELSGASEYLGEAAVGGQINKDDVIYISSITFYEKSPADKITYNITYNANGGSGAPSAQTKNYGTALTLSTTVPTRTGHTFLGWATSSNAVSATYEAGDSYTDNADVTLYAVWNRNLYYVNYNANGGNGTMSRTVHTYGISKELALNEFTRAGYDFLGWAKSSAATTATYSNGQSVLNISATPGATVNLYAVWKKKTYTVSYNANGGSGAPSAQTKNYGTALTLSTTVPARTGYTFCGWAESSSAVLPEYFEGGSYTKDENVTLYAFWLPNVYYIKYNANGGSGTMSNSDHTYDQPKALTSNGFTRTGYDFLGWAKSSTATTATYTNGQSVLNISATPGAMVNLYAVWKKKTYTISYNANGGSGAPSSQTKYYGTDLTLSTTVPTRSGYNFAGWSKTSTGSAAYQPGGVYAINGSTTLYAVWTPKTYTVSYNANGGTGAPTSQTKTHGISLTLSSVMPTRTGYEFKGWATSSTGYVMYLAGGTYSSNSSATLYAVWSEIEKYTVSYNANGGTGVPASHSQEIGKTTAVSSSVPTRNGYIFKGWSVVKDGAVGYNSGDTYSGNTDITLYAVWEKVIDPDAPIITVEKVTTVAGATVTVEVEIANNPGIWGLNAVVAFDNTVLTLTDVMCGDIFEGAEFVESTIGNSTYVLSFECSDFNDTELNGVLATLEFTISKDAEVGVYPITVTYSEGDIINSDEEIVGFELANGEVEVIDVIYGDVNGDGDVNKLDSLRLKKHLAGLDVEINEAAADVNVDGAVNKLDSLRLKKYLAGLDVVLGK